MTKRMISIKDVIDTGRKIAGLGVVLSLRRSRSGKSLVVSRKLRTEWPGIYRRVPMGSLAIENECVSLDALSKLLRGG